MTILLFKLLLLSLFFMLVNIVVLHVIIHCLALLMLLAYNMTESKSTMTKSKSIPSASLPAPIFNMQSICTDKKHMYIYLGGDQFTPPIHHYEAMSESRIIVPRALIDKLGDVTRLGVTFSIDDADNDAYYLLVKSVDANKGIEFRSPSTRCSESSYMNTTVATICGLTDFDSIVPDAIISIKLSLPVNDDEPRRLQLAFEAAIAARDADTTTDVSQEAFDAHVAAAKEAHRIKSLSSVSAVTTVSAPQYTTQTVTRSLKHR